jgi:hypothetical protein
MDFVNAAASTDQLKGSPVDQFQRLFPQYRHVFENITQANCSVQYDNYKSGVINSTNINYLAGGDKFTALTQPLIDCILDNTSEYLKGTMTNALVPAEFFVSFLVVISLFRRKENSASFNCRPAAPGSVSPGLGDTVISLCAYC